MGSPKEIQDIYDAVKRLDLWFEHNGLRGWDPYDIKDKKIFKALDGMPAVLPVKILRKLIYTVTEIFPLGTRRFLGVDPQVNAKGVGLLLSGYCNMFGATSDRSFLLKALECSEWLLSKKSRDYHGYGWGYPFDWKSPLFIPKYTPSSIASATIGDGFHRLYKYTGEAEYLHVCEEICTFFLKGLKITYSDADSVCYSYTPLDDYQVHNTNLFIGDLLIRTGRENGNALLIEQGIKCGNFALKEQQPEGFLPYWGIAQTDTYSNGAFHTDHYHSGFEIRMLYSIWKNTGDERFRTAYKKYFSWYLDNLFEDDGSPRLYPRYSDIINIHACSEAILCLSTLLPEHGDLKQRLETVLEWTLRTMEFRKGEYTYLIKRMPFIGDLRVDIPMIRWGQSWMYLALSEAYLKLGQLAHGTDQFFE